MPEDRTTKLGIVGAGSVGTSIAYAALIRGSAHHVALYDINTDKVDAEVLDLAHGAYALAAHRVTGGDRLDVLAGSDVVVITAGAKQKPGQTRIDLVHENARMVRDLMPRLVAVAPDAVFVVVSNPCDVLTALAADVAGLPAGRVFGSGTLLDTSRLRWLLAERLRVAVSSVHADVVGEHGDSEFVAWSTARIGSTPLLSWEPLDAEPLRAGEIEQIETDTKNAAYRIIRGKGATNNAIGLAATRIVEAVLRNEHAIMPVSTVFDGGAMRGVALSVPSIVDSAGARALPTTALAADEVDALHASAETLREVLDPVRIGLP